MKGETGCDWEVKEKAPVPRAWLPVSSASPSADAEQDPVPPSWTCWDAVSWAQGRACVPFVRAGAGWRGGLSKLVWKCSCLSPVLSNLGWEELPCVC